MWFDKDLTNFFWNGRGFVICVENGVRNHLPLSRGRRHEICVGFFGPPALSEFVRKAICEFDSRSCYEPLVTVQRLALKLPKRITFFAEENSCQKITSVKSWRAVEQVWSLTLCHPPCPHGARDSQSQDLAWKEIFFAKGIKASNLVQVKLFAV